MRKAGRAPQVSMGRGGSSSSSCGAAPARRYWQALFLAVGSTPCPRLRPPRARPPVPESELQAAIADLRTSLRERPLIAVVGLNDATETTDYLMTYGILRRADVADIVALAAEPGPMRLYPALRVDSHNPDGADCRDRRHAARVSLALRPLFELKSRFEFAAIQLGSIGRRIDRAVRPGENQLRAQRKNDIQVV